MDQKKMLFIYNPTSGKGRIKAHLADILDVFAKADYAITVYPTQAAEDGMNKAEELANQFDLVVCSGGDGTLDEVVTGMLRAESRTPLGFIPAGSTNDFAKSLKIPADMVEAAKVAVHGKQFLCDVGEFNKGVFVYVAAFGLFTDVSYQTDQRLKNIFGHVAYVLEGAKRLKDIPSYHLKVKGGGKEIEGDFMYGMITNSLSVGGLKNTMNSGIMLDDGMFEVALVVKPQNPIQTQEMLANLLLPNLMPSPYVYAFKTKTLEIQCDEPIPWTLDGEYGGDYRKVDILNHCRRFPFMVNDIK